MNSLSMAVGSVSSMLCFGAATSPAECLISLNMPSKICFSVRVMLALFLGLVFPVASRAFLDRNDSDESSGGLVAVTYRHLRELGLCLTLRSAAARGEHWRMVRVW